MMPLSAIVTKLLADSAITQYTGPRIYDHDVRRRKHPEIMDTDDKLILPTISVDDRGGFGRGFLAPSGTFQDTVYVWVFTRNDPTDYQRGIPANQAIVERLCETLHRWQDPVSRSMLTYQGRLGNQDGVLTESGMDYVQFQANGVFAVT